ncbi:anthranilate synthase family protein [Streptomyces sp. NBC_00122]|uniref:anthranilate synthase family protein n=1 Tax=Streptomyces sp. NBC_00122 TaxID=2903623 RepID=UPI0032445B40
MTGPMGDAGDVAALLDRLGEAGGAASFALLHRPEAGDGASVDVLIGEMTPVSALADIPLPPATPGERHEQLVLLPYRQIAERGYACPDDGEELLVMDIHEQGAVPLDALLAALPESALTVRGGAFDVDDAAYAQTARRIVEDEIGSGAGANFVLKRTYTAWIDGWSARSALALYGRLLRNSPGAYWTFLIRSGGRTLIGASPERHITLDGGTAVMNPISGTYRYPRGGATPAGVLEFLADGKERNELYMVLDEELKMMSRLCPQGGRVVGPRLREMSHLAHTEYFIEGHCDRDPREVLRETLFAPTVTGSPLESACHVIAKYEPDGRGYYAGVAALLGRDAAGERRLDSAILIRTADVDPRGRLRLGVGATLVRDSDPVSEAEETRAKAAGLLAALDIGAPPGRAPHEPAAGRLGTDPGVSRALRARNDPLAGFWRASPGDRSPRPPHLAGRRALLIDAEDTFTAMGATLLRGLGLDVTVRRFDEPYSVAGQDLVVVGPGPGDPRETGHVKIAHLRDRTRQLLAAGTPFLSVCLGHQALCGVLGLPLVRKRVPHQGVQRTVDLFGQREDVYFYNTFAALSPADRLEGPQSRPGWVEVSRDPATGEVHALRGPGFASVQFHPASVMTRNGIGILEQLIGTVLARSPVPKPAPRPESPRNREAIA